MFFYCLSTRGYPEESAHDDTFTYDAASRLLSATSNRYSNTVTRSYDASSNLASESLNIDGNDFDIAYAYDNADRQTGITYPNGKQVVRSYTDRNQLENTAYDSTVLSTHIYDAGGRETGRNLVNGVNTIKTYRNDNLISAINAPGILQLSYTYDANKRKLSEVDALRATASQTFAYDNQDRLNAWSTDSSATSQNWTLSPVGDFDATVRTGSDPINETRTHTNVHEVTAINGNSLGYDFKGNLASNGQNSQDYIWDAENRMQSIGNSVDAGYRYDALGRRVQKAVTVSSTTTTTTFVCGGAQVFTEYVNGSEKQSYVYASYVDEPLALIKTNGDTSFYHQNNLYSTEVMTDSSGNLIETYDYNSYGKLTIKDSLGAVQATSAVDNVYGFTGRRLDLESGLYYFRARYFDVELGRFIGRDPLGYVDGLGLYNGYFVPGELDSLGKCTCCCAGGEWTASKGVAIFGGFLVGYVTFTMTLTCDSDTSIQVTMRGEAYGVGLVGAIGSRFGIEGRVSKAPNCWSLQGVASVRVYGASYGVAGASAMFINASHGAYYEIGSIGLQAGIKLPATIMAMVGSISCG